MNATADIIRANLECDKDIEGFFDTMCVISSVLASIVFLLKIRDPKNRLFPDNFGAVSCGCAAGLSMTCSISGVLKRRHVAENTSGALAVVCQFQGVMFQIFSSTLVWHWSISMIVMYIIVVRKARTSSIRSRSKFYYAILCSLVGLTTAIPAIANKYGPIKQAGLCWIADATGWRFSFLYSHLLLGLVFFVYCMIPVMRELYLATQSETNTYRVYLLKDTMYQQVAQAAYLFIVFAVVFIYALNNLLLEVNWSEASQSKYIAATQYSYCVTNAVLSASIGVMMACIHSISHAFYQKGWDVAQCCFSKVWRQKKSKAENFACPQHIDEFADRENASIDAPLQLFDLVETPTGKLGTFCPSGYESAGCTAVSIPPDAQRQQMHVQASNAYTGLLLSNVIDRLAVDEADESDFDSTILTTTNEASEVDLDIRLQLAKDRWLQRYHNQD